MSRVWEDRVMAAHPLDPAHRMVLLVIARAVADGQAEALVKRADLARSLDAKPATVSRALEAGEQLRICRAHGNGRVEFLSGADLLSPLQPAPGPAPVNGTPVAPAPRAERLPSEHVPTPQQVLSAFQRVWEGEYRQTYVFTAGKDHRLAKGVAALGLPEIERRVRAYLRYPDPFYADCRHAFSIFVRDVNRLTDARPASEPRSRVPDAEVTRQRYLTRRTS